MALARPGVLRSRSTKKRVRAWCWPTAPQSIYLADLSGDGLTDLVRIRNGEVCYWPNLGYARFGAKVTMDHAPHLDNPDQFDQKRIRLADIDGSGTTDILSTCTATACASTSTSRATVGASRRP